MVQTGQITLDRIALTLNGASNEVLSLSILGLKFRHFRIASVVDNTDSIRGMYDKE